MPRILLLGFLLFASAFTAHGSAVEVQATRAIRIAVVDTPGSRDEAAQLQHAFGPRFEQAAAQIDGAAMPVQFVRVGPGAASEGLRRGVYDAAMVFHPRLPSPIRRSGFHVLRAASPSDTPETAACLILRRQEPRLDELLANAFSVALHHADVRRVLSARRAAVNVAQR